MKNNLAAIKRWFHLWGAPREFYLRSWPWAIGLGAFALLFIGTGVIWGLFFAPPDYQQGDSSRILYIHVPAAVLAQSIYVLIAAAAAVFLIWRLKMADVFMASAVGIGMVFCALALATGAIWGRPTWGTWWVWDVRTTSTLLLLFLYFGMIALRGALLNTQAAASACAILALVGLANIPVIKYSVDWWFTLHQSATFQLTVAPSMPPEMYMPLLATSLGAYFLFASALLLSMRALVLEREQQSAWVAELAARKASSRRTKP